MSDFKFLEDAIQKEMTYFGIPGCAISIIDHGRVSSLQFGYSDIDKKEPFTTDTISGIGSCTKSMTAFAALRLAEKKLLDIDMPVAAYINDFSLWDDEASKSVTVRDMLCHRTGLGGHDGTWPDNTITRIEFLHRIRNMEPNAQFRVLAQYSNVMYVAIGGILEAVSGKKWETIMNEEIFEPLKMKSTFCLMDDALRQGNCAIPYGWDNGLHALKRWNIDMAGPCGSVMSTVKDLSKWLELHINWGTCGRENMLSTENFLDMHTPQIAMDYPHIKGGHSLGYGLGWRVMDYHGHIVQQHTGKIEGYSAFQFYLLEKNCGAVFMQNFHAPDNPFIFTIQGLLLDYFLGRKPKDWVGLYTEKLNHAPEEMYHHLEFNFMPKRAVPDTKPSHELVDYAGTYENPGYGKFTIVFENKKLWLHERDVYYRPITHFNYDVFQVAQVKEDTDIYTLPLIFTTNDVSDEVIGFTLPMEPKVKPIKFKKIK